MKANVPEQNVKSDSNLQTTFEMCQTNQVKCFILIWMIMGSFICLVDFCIVLQQFKDSTIIFAVINHSEFPCDSIKNSDEIMQYMAVNIDIGYGENRDYLITVQLVVYGGVLLMVGCAILHVKKAFQGTWSICEMFGVLLITTSHLLALFTIRMGKIFISCAKDPNYDLLIATAVGSILLSLGNAMSLFYQSTKKATISNSTKKAIDDHRLKIHIP
ncbi:hypothetical protein T10_11099 [Trichinella papuae]|uniref:Transmembrane protein n=1 Tax=Trichinella papuae TaxID=268474 RepID=A0A0V1MAM3_9BILA|nr:hypothetical protein T10_11099 [Trichinella papuae]